MAGRCTHQCITALDVSAIEDRRIADVLYALRFIFEQLFNEGIGTPRYDEVNNIFVSASPRSGRGGPPEMLAFSNMSTLMDCHAHFVRSQ